MRRHAKASSSGSIQPPGSSSDLSGRSSAIRGGVTRRRSAALAAFAAILGLLVAFSANAVALGPEVLTESASGVTASSATLNGTINPSGATITDCHFEYGTTTSYGQSAPCLTDPGEGTEPVAVAAELSGLDPGTAYHFSLVAANSEGTANGADATFTTGSSPVAVTLPADGLGETSVLLGGRVDPHGLPTSFYVEYSTQADFSASVKIPASEDADAGSGQGFSMVARQATGLNPSTAYFFRLVASNTQGTATGGTATFTTLAASSQAACTNTAFRIGFSANLPECRAYEKVSPVGKNGYLMLPAGLRSATPSGDALAWGLFGGPAPGSQAGIGHDVLISERDPQAQKWTYRTLTPKVPVANLGFGRGVPLVEALSTDLSSSVVMSFSKLTADQPSSLTNLFLHRSDDSYEVLTPQPSSLGLLSYQAEYRASTPDMGHVVYSAYHPQTSVSVPDLTNYPYEWANGAVRLVSVLPDGSVPPDGAIIGSNAISNGTGHTDHAISADGKRIFFTAVDPSLGVVAGGLNPGQIYARYDADGDGPGDPITTAVSASRRTDCAGDPTCGGDDVPDLELDPGGERGRFYLGAEAEHGSKALFASCEQLTDDATSGGPGCEFSREGGGPYRGGSDLYLYDLEANGGTGELTDLTAGDPAGAGLIGFIGAGDDLSRIYYIAEGILANNKGAGGVTATPGEKNIYAWHDGVTTFVATLGAGTSTGFLNENYNYYPQTSLRTRFSRVSDNGRYLAFSTRRQISPYDNISSKCPQPDLAPDAPRPCLEVYRYDVVSDQLGCISCPGSGARSGGDAQLMYGPAGVASVMDTALQVNPLQPLNLLDDGTTFFETPSKLVPEDSNGRNDVYEFRDGRPQLISDGSHAADSHFAEATPDGSDVFFYTNAKLVPGDIDDEADIYDARVNGGFSAPPVRPPECAGDACQPAVVPPNDPTPGSSTYAGPGSRASGAPARKRCAKGRKSRKGKCVKAKRGRAQRTGHDRRAAQ